MLLYLVLNAVAIAIAYNNSNIILHFSQRALSRPTHTHLLRVGMFVVVRVRVLEFQFIHLHFDKIAAPLSFQTS